MKRGYLSQYFVGVGAKRLSAVEANSARSNQHEFNSTGEMRAFLGESAYGEKKPVPARYIWFGQEDSETVAEEATATHYQSRKAPRSEYRLYFPTTSVSELMSEGDSLFVAKQTNESLLIVIVKGGTTRENQLKWLFGLSDQIGTSFEAQQIDGCHDLQVGYVVRYILEELGIEPEDPDGSSMDGHIERFGLKFPKTTEFSALARNILRLNPKEDPDDAIVRLMDFEERLFLRLERNVIAERLRTGFLGEHGPDVESFIEFSLSVQNRRKSRVGHALENHVAYIFDSFDLLYDHGVETEHRKKPDFLFPGKLQYEDPAFPADGLSMLGVKSTCKDRWRQVLDEAIRISNKHLLTLEPAISEAQTNQMRQSKLQLALPASLHATYKPEQRKWLYSLSDFIGMVYEKQRAAL